MRKKNKILIVDDTPLNIQILEINLKDDYEILTATNGKEALEVLKSHLVDLILLDIMMPIMNGYETCKQIKESQTLKEIPVIFLTAKIEPEDIVKGFQLGAVDYITKPFQAIELLARVKTHIDLKKSKENLLIQNQENKKLLHILSHDLNNPLAQIKSTLELTQDDPSFFIEIKEDLLTSVQNGLELIDLVRQMRLVENYNLILSKINLHNAVEESKVLLKNKIEHKKIQLETNIPSNIEILAEKTSLVNNVLNNLLTNAIKFSFENSIIKITAKDKEQEIIFSIQDFGIGMPKEILENVFEMGSHIIQKGTHGEQGTGYGIHIVKNFIERYNAKIEVFSKDKKNHPQEHGTIIQIIFSK